MSVAISDHYQHPQAKPGMPEKRHLVEILPTSQSPTAANPVAAGSQIQWLNLPTAGAAPGSYISTEESYMSITVRILTNANATPGAFTKVGVPGLFERIDVTSSGHVVESSQHHPQLLAVLGDIADGGDDRSGYRSLTHGYYDTANSAADTLDHSVRGMELDPTGPGTPHTVPAMFILPLQGHFFNSTKRLPVHAIQDLAYILTLAQGPAGVCTPFGGADGSVTGFQIEGIKLHLTYIEVSPQSRSMLTSRTGMSWSSPAWEVVKDTLDAGPTAATFKVPSAKSSMKTLVTTFRSQGVTDPATRDNVLIDAVSRVHPGVATFQHSVNGILTPENPVAGKAEAAAEMKKAFHDTHGNSKAINYLTWAANAPNGAYHDTYMIAQGFEGYSKSNSSFTGVSTLAMNPMVKVTFNAAVPNQLDVFHYVHYDLRYAIENSVVRASY